MELEWDRGEGPTGAVTVVLTMVTGVSANVVALVTPAQEQTLLYRAVPEQALA